MYNSEIIKKAKAKLAKEEQNKLDLQTCIEAKICPKCGAEGLYYYRDPKDLNDWKICFSRRSDYVLEGWKCRSCSWNNLRDVCYAGVYE